MVSVSSSMLNSNNEETSNIDENSRQIAEKSLINIDDGDNDKLSPSVDKHREISKSSVLLAADLKQNAILHVRENGKISEDKEESVKSQSGPSSLSTSNTNYTTNFFLDNLVTSNSSTNSADCSSQSSSCAIDVKIDDTCDINNAEDTGETANYYNVTTNEENYEGFGYADLGFDVETANSDNSATLPINSNDGPGHSFPECNSPNGPNSLTLKSTSPSSTIGRHSWLRTSLRRTPPCTGRQRQLGSNALASQLYRSGSFNSSGRGSTCDPALDDMYTDVSLEDDVMDLNNRVRMIQEQMHVLTDTHSVGEERYARVKQENATLQARILMLEEASKDAESRAEEKLETEQRRHREWTCRLEREKQLQLENCAIKMQTIELESTTLRDQISRLREQLETAREDRNHLDNINQQLQQELTDAHESERHSLARANEARTLLDAAKEELSVRTDDRLKLDELQHEVQRLRERNKILEESRDELQAAAAIQVGRELLFNLPARSSPSALGPNYDISMNGNGPDQTDAPDSLAVELSISRLAKKPLTMPEMAQALKEQQEVNAQLRAYIDGILLSIVENYPQLLEVKQHQANNNC